MCLCQIVPQADKRKDVKRRRMRGVSAGETLKNEEGFVSDLQVGRLVMGNTLTRLFLII